MQPTRSIGQSRVEEPTLSEIVADHKERERREKDRLERRVRVRSEAQREQAEDLAPVSAPWVRLSSVAAVVVMILATAMFAMALMGWSARSLVSELPNTSAPAASGELLLTAVSAICWWVAGFSLWRRVWSLVVAASIAALLFGVAATGL